MLALKLTEWEDIVINVGGERIVLRFYWKAFDGYDDPYIAIEAPKEWVIRREKREVEG